MPSMPRLGTCLLAASLALAGCGKISNGNLPLDFVPADTPYVFGNSEPTPQALLDRYAARTAETWPLVMNYYQNALDNAEMLDADSRHVAQVILDELKPRDNVAKWREIGLRPDAHLALFGIGAIPVLRLELGDGAALKATIERVEHNAGKQLGRGRVDQQDYWIIEHAPLQLMLAIEADQAVLTISPNNASDDLRRKLLGLIRPEQTVVQAGKLTALNEKFHYLANGSGYLDVVRLVDLFASANDPVLQEFATELGNPLQPLDPACHADALAIAQKMPRLSFGYEALTAQRMQLGFHAELEPALAADVLAASSAAPGTGAASDSLLDVAIALPALKLKDFWLKQARALVAKPFACKALADLNAQAKDAVSKLDNTLPPPLSDIKGLRFTLTSLEPKADGVPKFSGKLLLAMSNPLTSVAMAQLALPTLRDVKFNPDSKPVPVPLGGLISTMPPLFAAMSSDALAISAGAGEELGLPAYLAAPAASQPVFMRMSFSGALYGLIGKFTDVVGARLGPKERAQMAKSTQMMAGYEKWLRRGDVQFSATPDGIYIEQTQDLN